MAQQKPETAYERPANVAAEAAVLGSILIDGQMVFRVKAICEPDDFTDPRHRLIYNAMLDLAADGMAIDNLTVSDRLAARDQLKAAGGDGFITGLALAPVTFVHGEHYAQIVHKTAARRELIDTAAGIVKDAFAGDEVDTLLADSRARIAGIERDLRDDDEGMALKPSVTAYLDLLEQRHAERDKPKIAFPWEELARLMPFLDSGTLVALVAEPGAGKTAFMECCAEKWAREGRRVLFFHFELSTQMMLDRRMQRHTGIPIRNLQIGGRLGDGDTTAVVQASDQIYAWPGDITYMHCPGWTMAQVTAAVRKAYELRGVDVVIVDYLNKVRMVDRNGMNSAQLRGQDIEDFKVCLEETGIVGLIAAQFDKTAKRLRVRSLADARDTGELEDKANVGIVIDRPRDDQGQRGEAARVSIVKCNAGQEGTIDMIFRGERIMFYPVQRVAL